MDIIEILTKRKPEAIKKGFEAEHAADEAAAAAVLRVPEVLQPQQSTVKPETVTLPPGRPGVNGKTGDLSGNP